ERFAARRRIPTHAFALKKYLAGIEVRTSTCDNKHTLASLGQVEMLGIEDAPRDCSLGSIHNTSVRPARPWRLQLTPLPSQCARKVAKGVRTIGEHAWDVFPDDDDRRLVLVRACVIDSIGELRVFEGEGAARI